MGDIATERLYWDTAKKTLYPEGHINAAVLACAPGEAVPAAPVWSPPGPKPAPDVETKAAPQSQNKAQKPGKNK